MKDQKISPASVTSTINVIKFMVAVIFFVFTLGFYLSGIKYDISNLARNSKTVAEDNKELNKMVTERLKRVSDRVLFVNRWIQGAEIRFLKMENSVLSLNNTFERLEKEVAESRSKKND